MMMTEFSNEQIFPENYPDFEEVQLTPISQKYLQVVLLNTAIFSLFILMAASVGFFFLREVSTYSPMIFLVATVFVIWIFVQRYFSFFQKKYAFREKDVIYHYGLLQRHFLIIPYNRIQHVALSEGWYSRILGLKSLSVFTAASADITIHGLPKEIAEGFNQMILKTIQNEEIETTEIPSEENNELE